MSSKFQKKIWEFYKKNKRSFPWRETTNPYHILISEVMLQQTQTNRVLPKYQEFLNEFPTIQDLAHATNTEVLKIWSGLGYNRRALYLKKIAEVLTSQGASLYHSGSDYEATHRDGADWLDTEFLKTLPGIGPNTAGSMYVFSTNKPYVFIETNIRRVFIHEFFEVLKKPMSSEASTKEDKVDDKQLLPLIKATLDQKNPREWYFALMDYGAYLSKAKVNPNRKSKHYKKQSKFKDSLRQTRGNILKILLNENTITIENLQEKISSSHFEKALQTLKDEGFVRVLKNNQIQIY